MSADPALLAALDHWIARDPAARLRLFVRESRTLRAGCRLALGDALRASVWKGSDPRVIEAKSAWWLQELANSATRHASHPLTSAVAADESAAFDWRAIATAFAQLRAASAPDAENAVEALAEMERVLWFGPDNCVGAACHTRARAILLSAWAGWLGVRVPDLAVDSKSRIHQLRYGVEQAAPGDRWTAALRAQALCVERNSASGLHAAARNSSWREVWSVWRAVREVGATGIPRAASQP